MAAVMDSEWVPVRKPLGAPRHLVLLLIAALISVGALLCAIYGQKGAHTDLQIKMLAAARLMQDAISIIGQCRVQQGFAFSPDDINHTGLVGLRYSPITTTIGDLAAKRTTTNPNFAALLVYLLHQAGVKEGDAIAIGASGSFPALIIATLAAAKVMGLYPILICSLGASQWGANEPYFTWLVIEDCLVGAGIFPEQFRAVAVSLGGDRDIAEELSPDAKTLLMQQIQARSITFIYIDDLVKNVQTRLQIYYAKAGMRRLAAFVSIGGSWVDLGEDPSILLLNPGLNFVKEIPKSGNLGVIWRMAAEGLPIIHLLNIRDLTIRYGLPWDPSPLPQPGTGGLFAMRIVKPALAFYILTTLYFGLILIILCLWNTRMPFIQ